MRIKVLIGVFLGLSVVEAANQEIEESLEATHVQGAASVAGTRRPVESFVETWSDSTSASGEVKVVLPSSFRLPISDSNMLPSLNNLVQRRNAVTPLVEPFPIPLEADWKNEALTLLEDGMLVPDVMQALALAEDNRSTVEALAAQVKERNDAKIAYYLE